MSLHDSAIAAAIARDYAMTGAPVVIHTNDMARRFGTTRRTICKTMKRLATAGRITEVRRTPEGWPAYAPGNGGACR